MDDPYPDLTAKHRDILAPMFPGWQFERGWVDLVDQTLDELRRQAPDVVVSQVKEKMGTLRVYLADKMDPVTREITRKAEERSASICDQCGEPGATVCAGGRVCTRCPQHAANL
jgi:hypothetical protein